MKKLLFWLVFVIFFYPVLISAAEADKNESIEAELAVPHSAILSPTGARLNVTQKLRVKMYADQPVIEFALPADAGNLQLAIPDHTIVRWHTTPVLLNQGSPLAGRRAEIEKAKSELSAKLMTVNSRLSLWQALPKSANAQDIIQLQTAMQEAMPELSLEQSRLERELKLINEELSRMPRASDLGERVRVTFADNVKPGQEITVNYSYTHDGCGWEAIYVFDARPNVGSGDMIHVQMLAEVWQYTGINWDETAITLVTQDYGPREPASLPEWVIDSARKAPQVVTAARPQTGMKTMKAANAQETSLDKKAFAEITADTESIFASWKLPEKGLAQGRSRMQITAAAWKAPLQWLARPSRYSNQVWLMAKYILPPDQAWPAGLAEYSVNGQNVGVGEFRPKSGEATLYFGSDPRVTVRTIDNARRRGESGIINTSKSWTWSWTYVLHNDHDNPVQVRVERPMPMIVDKDVKATYSNKPPAETDAREHMFYWIVDVPAHGTREIEHSVNLASPAKLPLLPDVP